MVSLAVEMQDVSNVHAMLVVPSPRRVPTAKEVAAFVSRLAPIEMATPSISSVHPAPPARVPRDEPAAGPRHITVQGWGIPLAYAVCGMVLCLCNILVPDGVVACAHVLCPVWTLALAVHAVAIGDAVWAWLAALTAVLLPFVLLVRHPLFVLFYLLVFAAFGSGRFWQTLHGVVFVLACVCWFGLAAACVLSGLADHPRAQVSVAAFFSLAVACISSAVRFGKLVLRVSA